MGTNQALGKREMTHVLMRCLSVDLYGYLFGVNTEDQGSEVFSPGKQNYHYLLGKSRRTVTL